jgi:ParE toxin of type II toxin-antitoxin system, parDE
MEKKIIVTKRFRNNTLRVYQYLLKEFSAKTAFQFLEKLAQRIELIIAHPTIGKPLLKKQNIRSIIFTAQSNLLPV